MRPARLGTRLLPAALVLGFCCTHALAVEAVVEQPRAFGYVLGDTLVQRVLLQVSGRNFHPESLPPAERAGLWFARRSAFIERSRDGRSWLVMDYQLINAPQSLMTVNLPAVSLKPAGTAEPLTVSEWPVSIGPLTPRTVFAKGGLQQLRPDRSPPPLQTISLERGFEASIAACLLVLIAWAAWWTWRQVHAAANQPFARALHRIRRGDENQQEAWVEMHRAFDRTAGQALQPASLGVLFDKAPHFAAERESIEEFFRQSSRRFFAEPGLAPADFPLRKLCAALRRLEKRHES